MEGQPPNTKKWVVFYPVYINSKKTVAEGRRISLSKACENPTCVEIGDCCNHLKLPSVIESDFVAYVFVMNCSYLERLREANLHQGTCLICRPKPSYSKAEYVPC